MRAMGLALVMAAAASSGGCKEAHVHEAFFPDLHESRTVQALAAQTVRGAREDATLYPMHFDGPALNSLGQAKLDLMLEDGAGSAPVTVYLGAAEGHAAERRAAVELYLAGAGLRPEQFVTVAGANPHVTHPASESLSRVKKTESPQGDLGNAETAKLDVGGMAATPATAE